ncbi:MAG TPA: tetratricopeptide repeat-containing sensor histidine kinase [Chryseosolibacter sp.]
MKQYRFFLYLWLFLPLSAFSQNLELIEKIKLTLPTQESEQRYNALNDLAWEYRFAYPDSTIYYSEIAYDLGLKLKLTKGLARAVNVLGIAQNYKGERLKAFEFYSKALEIATSQNDSLQIAHANNNIGRLFYEQGILSRSYDYFVTARSIFTAINDSSGVAYTYQSLANLYKSQRDYENAEENYLKAYEIRLALGNPRDIMSALVYLARHYQDSNNPEKAIHYLRMADSTGHTINDEINLAEIKTYLAESYLAKGRLKEAEAISKEGMDVILRKNNLRMMPQAYQTMGLILLQKNDLMGARKQFEIALDVADRIKDLNGKMEAYYHLWKVSEKLHDTPGSINHQNQYLILKDSIKDLDLTRQVERLQFEIDIQRKEQENAMLKADQEKIASKVQQQKLQNLILIVIIGFISMVGLLQWLNATKRRSINEKLLKQNEEIQTQRGEIITQNDKLSKRNQQLSDLNHEKDTLMSIVAHDLKSPLNRIDGLIYLMEMDNKLTPEQRNYLAMMRDATGSGLDLITDLLDVHMIEENVEPNYTTFDISHFLLEKTEAFQQRAASKGIHLNIKRVENEEIFTDRSYLDRIFDNLLSNAIKFSPKNSIVDISADRTEYDFWISVKDRGPGFSSHDQEFLFKKFKKLSARPTAGETSNGLGLAIVKILVDRLKGKIELTTQQGKGSEFVVRFPQQKQFAAISSVPL